MISLPLPPQLSQLFPAKFEFCNGGQPKPDIIAQLITLLVDITGADPGFQKGGWMADHIY